MTCYPVSFPAWSLHMSNTFHISTHHCTDLTDAYGDYDFSSFDRIVVGETDTLFRAFAQNTTIYGEVLLMECRSPWTAAGCFAGCTGLTVWPKSDTGRTKDVTHTNGTFRGCSNVAGFMPWRCSPVLCHRMFQGCTSWDGKGIQGVTFENTVHVNSMMDICKDVPLSDYYLSLLLTNIRDTVPAGTIRNSVNVGCGPASALSMRLMDSIDPGVEIVHEGPQEVWDYDFDFEVGGYNAAAQPRISEAALDLAGVDGLDGQFVSAYNGCLVAPKWGVFANHYLPPVGFKVTARSGEVLTVESRVRGPLDLGLVKFVEEATTEPCVVWDCESAHEYFYRDGYIEEALGHPLPIFLFDQDETARVFTLHELSEVGGVSVGPFVGRPAAGNGFLRRGDSGSITFLVNGDGHALVVNEVFSASGGGTSIGHHREWIEGVIGTGLLLGT